MDVVERIEILKQGASAVYGSDAVAGVVNIITRQQFTGGAINADRRHDATRTTATSIAAALTLGIGRPDQGQVQRIHHVRRPASEAPSRHSTSGAATSAAWTCRTMAMPMSTSARARLATATTTTASRRRAWSATSGRLDPVTGARRALPVAAGLQPGKRRGAAVASARGTTSSTCKSSRRRTSSTSSRAAPTTSPTRLQGYTELSLFQSKVEREGPPAGNTNGAWYDTRDNLVIDASNTILPVGNPANPFNAQGQDARLRYINRLTSVARTQNVTSEHPALPRRAQGQQLGLGLGRGVSVHRHEDQTRPERVRQLSEPPAGAQRPGWFRLLPARHRGGQQQSRRSTILSRPHLSYQTDSTITQFEAKGSRDLMQMDGGAMALALGAGYRHEYRQRSRGAGDIHGRHPGLRLRRRERHAQRYQCVCRIVHAHTQEPRGRRRRCGTITIRTSATRGIRWSRRSGSVVPSFVVRGTFATGFRAPGPAEIGNCGQRRVSRRTSIRCAARSPTRRRTAARAKPASPRSATRSSSRRRPIRGPRASYGNPSPASAPRSTTGTSRPRT